MAHRDKSYLGFGQIITEEGRLAIPRLYKWETNIMSNKVVLRDKYRNLWLVEMAKDGGQIYFTNGWKDFASDNNLVPGDTIAFQFTGSTIIFDVKLILGSDKCEKFGVGRHKSAIVKDEEIEQDEEMPDQITNGIETLGESDNEADEEMEINHNEETSNQISKEIGNCGESDDEAQEEMEINHNEKTSNQISEEIGYCGERVDDTGEEEEQVQVPRKSKAKFQSKLKAFGPSSSRATASPVGLPNSRPRRSCAGKTAAAIKRNLQEETCKYGRAGKKLSK